MLIKKLDMDQKLSKEEYRSRMGILNPRLNLLQRMTAQAKLPVILVFEGWEASGKGTSINQIVEWLDPRHFKVHPIFAPTQEETLRPYMWRFWQRLPNYGEWTIFDRSWYRRVLVERVDKLVPRNVWEETYNEINTFERALYDDGAAIIKFWLHITKKEQGKRFEELEKSEYARWVITDEDRREHAQYDKYVKAIDEMFVKTSTFVASWNIIEATNRRFRQEKITALIVKTVEGRLKERAPEVYEQYVATCKQIEESAAAKKADEKNKKKANG